jgi:hypothetical protein
VLLTRSEPGTRADPVTTVAPDTGETSTSSLGSSSSRITTAARPIPVRGPGHSAEASATAERETSRPNPFAREAALGSL